MNKKFLKEINEELDRAIKAAEEESGYNLGYTEGCIQGKADLALRISSIIEKYKK
jgi:hypothetical protein